MPENALRQRTNHPSSTSKAPTDRTSPQDEPSHSISLLDILRILLTLAVISTALSYYLTAGASLFWGYQFWFLNPSALTSYLRGPVLLTPSELLLYNGTDATKPIYLAINGTIYDVSAGRHTYGPGGSYSVFAGRDATRAFVTGCFAEDRTADMRGAEEVYLPVEDVEEGQEGLGSGERKVRAERERREARKKVQQEVKNWVDFYGKSKKYFEVGKVVGVSAYTGEPPRLCEAAQKGRPKRSKMGKKKDAAPGKPVQ